MKLHQGETFDGVTVEIDDCRFIGCTFGDVVLKYGGGAVGMSDNVFTGKITWELVGTLAQGLDFIRQLSHAGGPKHVKGAVDFVSAFLRKKPPTQTITFQ